MKGQRENVDEESILHAALKVPVAAWLHSHFSSSAGLIGLDFICTGDRFIQKAGGKKNNVHSCI